MAREVTVRVPPAESRDLLERPARACIGFVAGGRPRIESVHVRYEGSRYLIGLEPGSLAPRPSDEVVLVVDEGTLFFELRALYVRGVAGSSRPSPSPNRWFELEPLRESSWDYGRMRWTRDLR